MSLRIALHSSVLALAAAGLVACGGGDDDQPSSVRVGDAVVLTEGGLLLSFNRATPGTQVGAIAVGGLTAGDVLVGIDVRPADGKLYGLGRSGSLYTLDASTGMATLKSTLAPTTGDDSPYTTLAGTQFAVDFNPVADRLRVISDTGLNLRINVDTGAALTDGTITPTTSVVTAAAYTNSFAGTTATQLFDIDATAGRLMLQNPPNAGVLNAGVALGVTAQAANGFDIDGRTNAGYAVLRVGGETALYTIDVTATTGNAATRVGAIAGAEAVRGLALNPVPAN